jgi:hypothetical protein
MMPAKLIRTPNGQRAPLFFTDKVEPNVGGPFDAQVLVDEWIASRDRVSRFATGMDDDLLPHHAPSSRRRRRPAT